MRSGRIFLTGVDGVLEYTTVRGYGWSSRSATYASSISAGAYYLRVEPAVVIPSNGPYDRYNAFPLRCLSTVLGM